MLNTHALREYAIFGFFDRNFIHSFDNENL
jgi:hypothetical protein